LSTLTKREFGKVNSGKAGVWLWQISFGGHLQAWSYGKKRNEKLILEKIFLNLLWTRLLISSFGGFGKIRGELEKFKIEKNTHAPSFKACALPLPSGCQVVGDSFSREAAWRMGRKVSSL
jgi:hypothetical protein